MHRWKARTSSFTSKRKYFLITVSFCFVGKTKHCQQKLAFDRTLPTMSMWLLANVVIVHAKCWQNHHPGNSHCMMQHNICKVTIKVELATFWTVMASVATKCPKMQAKSSFCCLKGLPTSIWSLDPLIEHIQHFRYHLLAGYTDLYEHSKFVWHFLEFCFGQLELSSYDWHCIEEVHDAVIPVGSDEACVQFCSLQGPHFSLQQVRCQSRIKKPLLDCLGVNLLSYSIWSIHLFYRCSIPWQTIQHKLVQLVTVLIPEPMLGNVVHKETSCEQARVTRCRVSAVFIKRNERHDGQREENVTKPCCLLDLPLSISHRATPC